MLTKRCPRCGYQPDFWKNRPWGYYCPDCGTDLKPGKALFKPWKRLAYLVAGIMRVDAILFWMFLGRFLLSPACFGSLVMQSADLFFRNWILLFVAVGFLPPLASVLSMPFDFAHFRAAQYNRLLKHGRDRAAGWFSRPRGILFFFLLVFVLPGLIGMLFEFVLEPRGVNPIDVFASPWLLLPLAAFIGWLHIRNIKASHQPLYPLQWNPTENRFVQLKPQNRPDQLAH